MSKQQNCQSQVDTVMSTVQTLQEFHVWKDGTEVIYFSLLTFAQYRPILVLNVS